MGPAAFAREFLCVWQASGARVIPAAAWSAIRHRDATPDAGTSPVIAFDVAIDRSAAAVVACWRCGGVPVLEVIEYAPGTGWVAPLVKAISSADRPPVIMADSAGPVVSVVDELTAAGVTVTTTSTREFTAACAAMLDAVVDGTVLHRGDPALEVAAAGANRRTVGDAWAWGRRTSTAEISPLVAASLALWADRHRPPAPVRPVVTAG
jgi:hypothetical protein